MKSFTLSILLCVSTLGLAPATCMAMRSYSVQSPLQFPMDDFDENIKPQDINIVIPDSHTMVSDYSRSTQIASRPSSSTKTMDTTPTIARMSPSITILEFMRNETPKLVNTPMPEIEEEKKQVPHMRQRASSSPCRPIAIRRGIADGNVNTIIPEFAYNSPVMTPPIVASSLSSFTPRMALARAQQPLLSQHQALTATIQKKTGKNLCCSIQ